MCESDRVPRDRQPLCQVAEGEEDGSAAKVARGWGEAEGWTIRGVCGLGGGIP